MKSKLQQKFEALRQEGCKALIPYVCAGDPTPETTVELLHSLVKAGASAIEVGIPFSDPMADGEVIQQASERALSQGVSLRSVLGMVKEFRKDDQETPIILMGYANPIEKMGIDEFAQGASESGVNAVLVVDYPPHESTELNLKLREKGIDMIYLLAPTSTEQRIKEVAEKANGFLYYVAVTGVTGTKNADSTEVSRMIPRIRRYTDIPLVVGFGIKDAKSACENAKLTDGVVIGSQLIREMHKDLSNHVKAGSQWLHSIREAMDKGNS